MFYANAACLTDVDYEQAQVSHGKQQSLQEKGCAMQQWTAGLLFFAQQQKLLVTCRVREQLCCHIRQQTRLAIVSLKKCPMLLLYWSWCWVQWQLFTCSSVVPVGRGRQDRWVSRDLLFLDGCVVMADGLGGVACWGFSWLGWWGWLQMSHFNESSQLHAGVSPGCLMQRLKARVLTHFRRAFEKCDVILMPATPDTAGQVPAAVATGGMVMVLLQQDDALCRHCWYTTLPTV